MSASIKPVAFVTKGLTVSYGYPVKTSMSAVEPFPKFLKQCNQSIRLIKRFATGDSESVGERYPILDDVDYAVDRSIAESLLPRID